MNKFYTIFVLFAAVVCCTAEELTEDEEKEVNLLMGNQKLFVPFCLGERAKISQDISRRVAERSSDVFQNFFGATTEIADEILTVQKEAVAEFAKQLASPSQEVSDEPQPEQKILDIAEQTKRDILNKAKDEINAQNSVFGRLAVAIKSAVGPVLYNVANTSLFVRLMQARTKLTGKNLLNEILESCKQVAEYEATIEKDFEATKSQLEADSEGEVQKFINSVTLPSLKCHTIKYITRLNAFCNLFKDGAAPFMKMLGITADLKLGQ